jgi:uncharacterized protein YkwD
MIRPAALLVAASLALSGCAGLFGPAVTRDVSVRTADAPAAAAAISAYRRAHNLPAVRVDPVLTRAAEHQARAMAGTGVFSHDVAGAFGSRMRQFGTGHSAAAENLSVGARNLGEAIADWKASPGHNRNLLLAEATRIGLVRADGAGPGPNPYWVLILAD